MKINMEFNKIAQAKIKSNLCVNCGKCSDFCATLAVETRLRKIYKSSINFRSATDCQGSCNSSCPLGLNPQAFVNLIENDNLQTAYDIFREKCSLPYLCSSSCSAPCEENCRRASIDKAVQIRQIEKYIVENSTPKKVKYTAKLDKKIAVVGAGISGICCADELANMGYNVTIFEKESEIGGSTIFAMPNFKIDKQKLLQEMQAIIDGGITVKTGVEVGKDVTIADLRKQGFSAIVLAIGSSVGKTLKLENGASGQIYDAMTVLKSINQNNPVAMGQKAIVIGAGSTGLYTARLLKRLNIDVTCVCAEDRKQLPSPINEVKDALKEGVNIIANAAPVKVLRKNKAVTGIDFLQVESVTKDDSNNRQIVTIEDANFSLECDTIVFAIGQKPDTETFEKDNNIEVLSDGRIKVSENGQTNIPYIFACGDVIDDLDSVILSMASGKNVANAVDDYVFHRTMKSPVADKVVDNDESKAIFAEELLNIKPQISKREVGFSYLYDINKVLEKLNIVEPIVYPNDKGKKVAVVGGGLGGVACAYNLATKGYTVTIFEKTNRLGGSLIRQANYDRVDKVVLTNAINKIIDAGITVEYNANVGENVNISNMLKKDFDYVVLAIGKHNVEIPKVDGLDAQYVYDANTFLTKTNSSMQIPVGKKAVVFGSNYLAVDSAVSLARMGVETMLITPTDKAHFDASDNEFNHLTRNGVTVLCGAVLNKVSTKFVNITAVSVQKVQKIAKDKLGKTKTTLITGQDVEISCDTIIFADELKQDSLLLNINDDIKLKANGDIQLDDKLQTNNKKVFALPNCENDLSKIVSLAKICVDAVESAVLGKKSNKLYESKQEAVQYDVVYKEYSAVKRDNNAYQEEEVIFTKQEAKLEAMRCMKCEYAFAKESHCIGCKVCSKICPVNAITMVEVKDE